VADIAIDAIATATPFFCLACWRWLLSSRPSIIIIIGRLCGTAAAAVKKWIRSAGRTEDGPMTGRDIFAIYLAIYLRPQRNSATASAAESCTLSTIP
jgi:hypothetical protein